MKWKDSENYAIFNSNPHSLGHSWTLVVSEYKRNPTLSLFKIFSICMGKSYILVVSYELFLEYFWNVSVLFFLYRELRFFFKDITNSIDFYKGISLHVISIRIIVQ